MNEYLDLMVESAEDLFSRLGGDAESNPARVARAREVVIAQVREEVSAREETDPEESLLM